MIEFNCTVKDIFRRPQIIDKAVRKLADNGYTEYVSVYAQVRDNMFNALAYVSANMKPHEYGIAAKYFGSRDSEQDIADTTFYTHRTIRRYVSKASELVREYYARHLGISLLPNDTRSVSCTVSAGTFWEKVNSLMNGSIENACVVIMCCYEHESVNAVCSSCNMGSEKVRKIVNTFESTVTILDIPEEKRSAV
jgi:hypothetical protein